MHIHPAKFISRDAGADRPEEAVSYRSFTPSISSADWYRSTRVVLELRAKRGEGLGDRLSLGLGDAFGLGLGVALGELMAQAWSEYVPSM